MAKHVAVTIAGAVSLGSYEAGVLYELLRAIRTRNEQAEAEHDDSKKIYIDVLTGASAGAMTAAMVAQRLMYDADGLEDAPGAKEPTNALYEAWVKRISLMGLVKMKWREPRWHSLFSSDLIQSIGHDMLVANMAKPGKASHSAVEKVNGEPLPLRVGFALTNLDGIDYMIPITGSKEGGFNYTTSADQKLFTITGDKESDQKNWHSFCHSAVASGAFPVAFRAQAIDHSLDEYGAPALPRPPAKPLPGNCYIDWPSHNPTRSFAHCDGGVLQNQPLGIAKSLVDKAVAERAKIDGPAYCDSDDRLYVFVSPHSVKSSAEKVDVKKLFILAEIKKLVSVYFRQAMFHDWITAEEVNRQITLLDERAYELAEVIKQGLVSVPELARAASDLNSLLMPKDRGERLERLRKQYSVPYNEVLSTEGEAAAEAYVAALATLEGAARLENRDKMKIVAVIASEKELAGAGLSAFVGFFRKSYRQHDYWKGRVKTRQYLMRSDVKKILDVDQWPEEHAWTTPLPNPTRIAKKPGMFSILCAAFVPGIIFLALRWITWLILAIVALAVWGGVWLAHH